jgi:hypothetical protein
MRLANASLPHLPQYMGASFCRMNIPLPEYHGVENRVVFPNIRDDIDAPPRSGTVSSSPLLLDPSNTAFETCAKP